MSLEMSELARELARTDSLKIDKVLAPVREALEGLKQGGSCWCSYLHKVHTNACMRAQELTESLKVE